MSNNHPTEPRAPLATPPESEDATGDPLLAALAAAEWDDEPYTDEQRALAEAGSDEIRRGESVSLEEVKKRFAGPHESRHRAAGFSGMHSP